MKSINVHSITNYSCEIAVSLTRILNDASLLRAGKPAAKGSTRARVHFGPPEVFSGARYDGSYADQTPGKWTRKRQGVFQTKAVSRQEELEGAVWEKSHWAATRDQGFFGRKARNGIVRVRRLMNCLRTGSASASEE